MNSFDGKVKNLVDMKINKYWKAKQRGSFSAVWLVNHPKKFTYEVEISIVLSSHRGFALESH